MTDENDRIDDLAETVASLQERVSDLERRLDSAGTETPDRAAYDHYDEQAIEVLDGSVADAHPREVMNAYEMAGIVDEKTKKKRAKRLKRLEGE